MEITVEKLKKPDFKYDDDGYTVYVGNHRILTISTYCYITASKWLSEVQKIHNNKDGSTLVVGVCAERENCKFEKGGLKDSPYDLLQICIGSHCLIYHLSQAEHNCATPKCFKTFFADPRVIVVGMDMVSLTKKLEIHHQIKIANPMDLNSMAVKGMMMRSREEYLYLDLGRYDLDQLAEAVLGKHMQVMRPEYTVEWYPGRRYCFRWFAIINSSPFSLTKVKYATVDPYLCFLIGSKLLDEIGSGSVLSLNKNKNKNKMKKRINA